MKDATLNDWAGLGMLFLVIGVVLYGLIHGYVMDPSCSPRPFAC